VLAEVAREGLRNRLMFALAYYGALRREELVGLRVSDLDVAPPPPDHPRRDQQGQPLKDGLLRRRCSACAGLLLSRAGFCGGSNS